MEQSVDSADVYECAVVGESHNCTFDNVIHVELFPDLLNEFLSLVCQIHLV